MNNTRRTLVWLACTYAMLGQPATTVLAAADREAAPSNKNLPNKVTDNPLLNSRFLLFGSKIRRTQTLRWIERHKRTDMIAPLIYSLRYLRPALRQEVADTLRKVAGKDLGDSWFKWKQWQQANPQITPFPQFDVYLSALFGNMDPGFKDFIYPRMKHTIRLEEIVWGGVSARDGIPPIDYPTLISAKQATYLSDGESVFGVVINGDVRAYPYRIMDWHEMLNDTVGGQPVSLAYCTLCGSGILFKTDQRGTAPHFQFGSSGLLYRSNKLMFDRGTNSLWNQFTGQPVVGTLAESDIRLETLPLVTTTWGKWRAQHPDTKVLDVNTGFERDYEPGKPYGKYFNSRALMFPTLTKDRQLKQKSEVFGLRLSGFNRAWPLKSFRGGRVINDQVGVLKVVLIGKESTRTVRAYRRGEYSFSNDTSNEKIVYSNDEAWQITESQLIGPRGEKLSRLPGHLAYWFAWHNYFGGDTLSKVL